MHQWCEAQNAKHGQEIYHVIDWPPPSEPEAPAEAQQTPPRPKRAPRAPKLEVVPPPQPKALTFLEQVVAERTVGLDTSNAVQRNRFSPLNDKDREVAARLVERGLMGQQGDTFHLTVDGFTALDAKRKIFFGVVG